MSSVDSFLWIQGFAPPLIPPSLITSLMFSSSLKSSLWALQPPIYNWSELKIVFNMPMIYFMRLRCFLIQNGAIDMAALNVGGKDFEKG